MPVNSSGEFVRGPSLPARTTTGSASGGSCGHVFAWLILIAVVGAGIYYFILGGGSSSGGVYRPPGNGVSGPSYSYPTSTTVGSGQSTDIADNTPISAFAPPDTPIIPAAQSTELRAGNVWRANGLALTLRNADVAANDVNTHFFVTNEQNGRLTFNIGPNEGYFVLTDNKGRAWTPRRIPDGKVDLGPGQTSGDIGPDFDGSHLWDEGVTELTLRVQDLGGTGQLTWHIAVNPIPSPYDTDTESGTILQVGQAWLSRGRELKLDRVEIRASDVNTKLYLTNKTSDPILFQPGFGRGYFELKDNLGRVWKPLENSDDRTVLSSGATSGDIGPRFAGDWLDEPQVQTLFFSVRGLAGIGEAHWSFTINKRPQNSQRPSTSPDSVLTVGEPWRSDDIVLRLGSVDVSASGINTHFFVSNETDSVFVFQTAASIQNFRLVDSKGRLCEQVQTVEGRVALQPGKTSGDIGPRFSCSLGDPDVTYATLTVTNLLGVQEAKWKIDVTH